MEYYLWIGVGGGGEGEATKSSKERRAQQQQLSLLLHKIIYIARSNEYFSSRKAVVISAENFLVLAIKYS